MAHAYNIIIDHGVGSPGHGRDVVDGLNYTETFFIYMIITIVQLPSTAAYETQLLMHKSTVNIDIIFARKFQQKSDSSYKNDVMDQGNYRNGTVKKDD